MLSRSQAASGAVCAGSNPAGGTLNQVPVDPATGAFAEDGVLAYVLLGVAVCLVLWAMRGMAAGQVSACHVLVAHVRG